MAGKKNKAEVADSQSELTTQVAAPDASSTPPVVNGSGSDSVPSANGQTAAAAKPVESKADKFRRLGNYRLPRAVKYIAAIGSLANKSQYEWTETQQAIIIGALTDAVNKVKNAFAGTKAVDNIAQL